MADLILRAENRLTTPNLFLNFIVRQVSYMYNTYVPYISTSNLRTHPSVFARGAARRGGEL